LLEYQNFLQYYF